MKATVHELSTLEEEWELFKAHALKKVTNPLEIEKNRLVFYSGYISLTKLIGDIRDADLPAPIRGIVVRKYNEELKVFKATLNERWDQACEESRKQGRGE